MLTIDGVVENWHFTRKLASMELVLEVIYPMKADISEELAELITKRQLSIRGIAMEFPPLIAHCELTLTEVGQKEGGNS